MKTEETQTLTARIQELTAQLSEVQQKHQSTTTMLVERNRRLASAEEELNMAMVKMKESRRQLQQDRENFLSERHSLTKQLADARTKLTEVDQVQ